MNEPNIAHNQPNWSWDAELICIEQGFRVFTQQENEDMEMGPLFDVLVAQYFAPCRVMLSNGVLLSILNNVHSSHE
jgi:hypothetical protein